MPENVCEVFVFLHLLHGSYVNAVDYKTGLLPLAFMSLCMAAEKFKVRDSLSLL